MASYRCFDVEQFVGATVVRLTDPLRMRDLLVGELQDELLDMLEREKPTKLVVDFGRVEFCSSAVIEALIRAKKHVVTAGGGLKLCDMRSGVREAFQILNLDGTVFDIHDSVTHATESF